MKRGEIYFADLFNSIGCEERGRRPVIVISNDKANQYSNVITIAPISSSITKKKLPTHVKIFHRKLRSTSFVMTEQIRTIDKKRLITKVGKVNKKSMIKINNAIKIQLALESDN